jgi:tetratricopeptide (TPR) repeat protein
VNRAERPLIILFSLILIVLLASIVLTILQYLHEKAVNDERIAAWLRHSAIYRSAEFAYFYFGSGVLRSLRDTGDAELYFALCLAGAEAVNASWDMLGTASFGCNQAIELDPTNGVYYDVRGLVYLRAGRPDAAIKDFQFYLTWLEANDFDAGFGAERRRWIAEIERTDPQFDWTYDRQSSTANAIIFTFDKFTNPQITISFQD